MLQMLRWQRNLRNDVGVPLTSSARKDRPHCFLQIVHQINVFVCLPDYALLSYINYANLSIGVEAEDEENTPPTHNHTIALGDQM